MNCSMSPVNFVVKLAITMALVCSECSGAYGPRVRTQDGECYTQSDCDVSLGQACILRFEGCDHGHCMCDPKRTPYLDSHSGKCIRGLREGYTCRAGGHQCPSGMSCNKGHCRCVHGQPTVDGEACMTSSDRLLGQPCLTGIADHCWQKLASGSGYTRTSVMCVDGLCTCEPGLRDDVRHCHKRKLGESCQRDNHCTGDALCISGQCACLQHPAYKPVADATKCAPSQALVDRKLGEACNEQEQKIYCAAGLVCHRCHRNGSYKCLRPIYPGIDGQTTVYFNKCAALRAGQHLIVMLLLFLASHLTS